MTTVDAWIRQVGGGLEFDANCGLFGFAANIMHALDTGPDNHDEGTCTGQLLLDKLQHYLDKDEFVLARKRVVGAEIVPLIDPKAVYSVGYVEF
jgi:hypothetical protein